MQQAIYTNTTIAKSSGLPGHGTGESIFSELSDEQSAPRFQKLRLLVSVAANVLGGVIVLSGMLMLPQLLVSLLGS